MFIIFAKKVQLFGQNIPETPIPLPLERFWINIIASQNKLIVEKNKKFGKKLFLTILGQNLYFEVKLTNFIFFKKLFLSDQNSPQIAGIVFFTDFRQNIGILKKILTKTIPISLE